MEGRKEGREEKHNNNNNNNGWIGGLKLSCEALKDKLNLT